MFLRTLKLERFRNYETLELTLDRHKVLFLGDNAQGKTNLLEAIALLGLGQSPFASRDHELIQFGSPDGYLHAQVERLHGPCQLDLGFRTQSRRAVRLNGLYLKRMADLMGQVAVVLFASPDLQLVKGAPADRRRYLDGILTQLYPAYYQALHQYQHVLSQRNTALRQIQDGADASVLDAWDQTLARHAALIWTRREALVQDIEPRARRWHAEIARRDECLDLVWQPSLEGTPSTWMERLVTELQQLRSRDIARGQTQVGPHRDDCLIRLDDREARLYASQGQQRTIVLALKLAELEIFTGILEEPPLLLLDDVLAELDIRRQNALLAAIRPDVQTFVTSTHLSDFAADWIEAASIHTVHRGRVEAFRSGS